MDYKKTLGSIINILTKIENNQQQQIEVQLETNRLLNESIQMSLEVNLKKQVKESEFECCHLPRCTGKRCGTNG